MKKLLNKIGFGRIAALVLIVLLMMLRLQDPDILVTLRGQAFDTFQKAKPREYKPLPVAIVDIDEESISKLGQWPWPRTKLADLIDKIRGYGAAAVAFDIVFAEEDRLSPDLIARDNPQLPDDVRNALNTLPSNEKVFSQSIGKFRVVMGQTSVRRATDTTANKDKKIRPLPHGFLGEDPVPYMRKLNELVQNRPILEDAATGRGVFNVHPDPDGVIRRVPLVVMVEDNVRLSLSTELLRVALGGNAVGIKTNEFGIQEIKLKGLKIETDETGSVWPYFSPHKKSRFIPVHKILDGTVNPALLQGRLLLVGTSAVGLEDYRATPIASQMAGVEIHAQIIENILGKEYLKRPSWSLPVEFFMILGVGLLAVIFVPMLGALWSLVCASAIILGYVGFSWYSFDQSRLLIDPVFPALSVALVFILLATTNYLKEEQQRKQIRGAFGQYVSPDLVTQLSNNPDALTLGGETRDLSILFSDVRGFTAISESYKEDPQGLTVLMNLFLTVLSNSILRYQGTIDKFMGDAVMAFWNAPLTSENHAHKSCEAAIDMIADVAALNAQRRAEYDALSEEEKETAAEYLPINVGIGINTGKCVVGNMGSDSRFDYTALGDTVNLASRLEGQSKPYGVRIVLGNATAVSVMDDFAVLEIDQIRVKGKSEPETIYGLFGRADLKADRNFIELQSLNRSMLNSYRKRDWESASALIELMQDASDELSLQLDDLLFIYKTRILEFEANPPGRNWDGVYNASSK